MWTLAKVKTDLENLFWSKNESNYWDVKLKVLRENVNKEFRNLTMGETDFNQVQFD